MEQGETTRTCIRCVSRRLIQGAKAEAPDAASQYRVTATLRRRGFLGVSVPVRGDITTEICADCGHTELRTNNLEELWDVYAQENR